MFKMQSVWSQGKSMRYRKEVKNQNSNIQQLSQLTFNRAFKITNIGNDQVSALFDSVCETAYTRIQTDILKPDITEKIHTLGSFTVVTKLDDTDVDMCFHEVRDKEQRHKISSGWVS